MSDYQSGMEIISNQMRHSLIGAMAAGEGELLGTPDTSISQQLRAVKLHCALGRANELERPLRSPPDSVGTKELHATAQDEVIGMANLIMLRQNEAPASGDYAAVGAEIRSAMGLYRASSTEHARGSLTSLVAQALGAGIDLLPDDQGKRTRSIFGAMASQRRVPGRSADRVNKVTGPVTYPFGEEERQAVLVLRINYWAFSSGDMPILADGGGKTAEEHYADLANAVLGSLIGT